MPEIAISLVTLKEMRTHSSRTMSEKGARPYVREIVSTQETNEVIMEFSFHWWESNSASFVRNLWSNFKYETLILGYIAQTNMIRLWTTLVHFLQKESIGNHRKKILHWLCNWCVYSREKLWARKYLRIALKRIHSFLPRGREKRLSAITNTSVKILHICKKSDGTATIFELHTKLIRCALSQS